MTASVPKSVRRKWLPLDRLIHELQPLKAAGKHIVFTNGCFDVIHAGHVRYLRSARQLGDCLVVAINDDASVRTLKGDGRPLYPLAERIEVLAALSFVTFITDFSSASVLPVIKKVRPTILAKGGDYRISQVVGWRFVQSYGGQVVVLDHVKDRSTTRTLRGLKSNTS